MADFEHCFEEMIRNEGGYVLHQVKGDKGGQTYAGIARRHHPDWSGWALIDQEDWQNPQLNAAVKRFYRKNFWHRIAGDDIQDQRIADTLFDFAVNTGSKTAISLAQKILGSSTDGVMGPITLGRINATEGTDFLYRYALAKVARYAEIVNQDRSQSKFLLGWINRSLRDIA